MITELLRPLIHYGIHFGLPFVIAGIYYRESYVKAVLILLAGILIDLDHLWASPLFDPERCSIGFHTLHQWPLIAIYLLLAIWPKTRLIGLALVIHILADMTDCLLMDL